MSDTEEEMEEEEPEKEWGPVLVGKVERIMSLRKEGTERLRSLWSSGEISALPCSDDCTGEISVTVDRTVHRGFCPVYMEADICPLTTKEERQITARMDLAGFGKRYHSAKIELIRPRETVESYLNNMTGNLRNGKGIVFSGGVGVGKTMALAYLARRFIAADHGVWCILMEDLISKLNDREQRRKAMHRAMVVEVLMLDDLGSGELPPYILGILEGIVEHRHARLMPTFVTTNLTREQIRTIPEFRRIVDRWRETCSFVNIGGASMRG